MSAGPRVLVMDGQENALSMARSLGRRGIWVGVTGPQTCAGLRSRYCRWKLVIDSGTDMKLRWKQVLIDNPDPELRGALLFAGSDSAVEFIAEHHAELAPLYGLGDQLPALQQAMLDKRRTLELGAAAGCPVPGYWRVDGAAELSAIAREVPYPCMIKPIHSHVFQRHFRCKYWSAHSSAELLELGQTALDAGVAFMVCEIIPGPDSALSSYYTYVDADGKRLFEYTKRVQRRYPLNAGGGTSHVSEWLPETAEMGRRFFDGIDFRGLGNIEFKRDPRDGQLKIIECNPRFTAAQELLVRSGFDIAVMIYDELSGATAEVPASYRQLLQMWYPARDFYAFLELRKHRGLSLLGWLRSLSWCPVLPFFSLSDPWPAVPLSRAEIRSRYVP